MEGTIKTIVGDKGFGFITSQDGDDYFFHHTQVFPKEEFRKFKRGDRVTFEDCEGDKGLYAEQVLRD